jgi:hypothetical protein
MAFVPLKAEQIAPAAMTVMERLITLPALIDTFPGESFKGVKNDTVTRRIPARVKARRKALRATGSARVIITDDLAESSISIKLTDHVYFATDCTDENLTLDITNFTEQILAPSVRGVVEELENQAYDVIADATYVTGLNVYDWQVDGTDANTGRKMGAWWMATSVDKILNRAYVPQGGRILLVGPEAKFVLLNDAKLEPGPGGADHISALQEATVGRIAGFTVVESPLLEDDECYAFTRSAFTQAVVAPVVPESLKFGKSVGSSGFGLRWIRDYDKDILSERSIVDVYTGASSVEDGRVPTVAPAGVTYGAAGGTTYNARAVKINLV